MAVQEDFGFRRKDLHPEGTLVGISGPSACPGVLCHREVILRGYNTKGLENFWQELAGKLTVRVIVPWLISNLIGEPPTCATGGQIDDQVEACRGPMMELGEGDSNKVSIINRYIAKGRVAHVDRMERMKCCRSD